MGPGPAPALKWPLRISSPTAKRHICHAGWNLRFWARSGIRHESLFHISNPMTKRNLAPRLTGPTFGVIFRVTVCIAFAVAFGVTFGVAFGATIWVTVGITCGILFQSYSSLRPRAPTKSLDIEFSTFLLLCFFKIFSWVRICYGLCFGSISGSILKIDFGIIFYILGISLLGSFWMQF